MYLGVDVGGTKVAAAVVSPTGEIQSPRTEPVDLTSDTSAAEQLAGLLGAFHDPGIRGVGIGIPGIADPDHGTVWAPNVRGWDHFPLLSYLAQKTSVPVVVESDRNTAVLGELLYGSAVGLRDVIFLILGTGIGAGIVSGGRLVRGAHHIAGAVGWIPVYFRRELQHFEEIAAGPALKRLTQEYLPGTSLPRLAEAARLGDKVAVALIEEVGEVVGQALASLVSTLDPQRVVVGGGVANLWDLMGPSALKALNKWCQPVAAGKVTVSVSRLGPRAGILGAAAAARESLEGRGQ